MSVDVESMTVEQQLEYYRAENAKLTATLSDKLTVKMGDKGTVSVYGLGRYPVSLYPNQWDKLLAIAGKISGFIADNADELERRGEISKAVRAAQ